MWYLQVDSFCATMIGGTDRQRRLVVPVGSQPMHSEAGAAFGGVGATPQMNVTQACTQNGRSSDACEVRGCNGCDEDVLVYPYRAYVLILTCMRAYGGVGLVRVAFPPEGRRSPPRLRRSRCPCGLATRRLPNVSTARVRYRQNACTRGYATDRANGVDRYVGASRRAIPWRETTCSHVRTVTFWARRPPASDPLHARTHARVQ